VHRDRDDAIGADVHPSVGCEGRIVRGAERCLAPGDRGEARRNVESDGETGGGGRAGPEEVTARDRCIGFHFTLPYWAAPLPARRICCDMHDPEMITEKWPKRMRGGSARPSGVSLSSTWNVPPSACAITNTVSTSAAHVTSISSARGTRPNQAAGGALTTLT